jgi:hypothetical protein
VDIVTLENYPSRKLDRKAEKLAEDYPDDDHDVNYPISGGEKDNMLDLGINKPISMLVTPRQTTEESRERERSKHALLEESMRWFKEKRDFNIDLTGFI